jgi:Suppressor of fused protein (SUFU)
MQERDTDTAVVETLRTHLETWWGSCDEFVWQRGPMHRDCPAFRVLRAERAEDGLWLYASAGASLLRQVEGTGHEFFLVAPTESPELVELVTIASHYAIFGEHDGVHVGHTLNIGRPWLTGSRCDHLYLSTAYLLPPEFAIVKHPRGTAHLLWAVPITEAEKRWRHEHGQEAFEQLMEDRELVPHDPARDPLPLP